VVFIDLRGLDLLIAQLFIKLLVDLFSVLELRDELSDVLFVDFF